MRQGLGTDSPLSDLTVEAPETIVKRIKRALHYVKLQPAAGMTSLVG